MTLSASQRWQAIALAAAAAIATAVLGALSTDLGPWYQQLRKPPWDPPDWLFGPAWTLIYSLAAASAVLAWWDSRSREHRVAILTLFGLNAALNIGWSFLFFRAKRLDWAMLEVLLLWLSILLLIIVIGRISRRAGWLLLPYLAWVSFAAALNYSVLQLNS